eukprot:COSAG01_NODE_269_length_19814_cov_109.983720_14_plen_46_part_00
MVISDCGAVDGIQHSHVGTITRCFYAAGSVIVVQQLTHNTVIVDV